MESLYVFDVSPFIHVGQSIGSGINRCSMPLDGIHYFMKFLTSCLSTRCEVVCCFDSPSFRKNLDKDYKGNRMFKPEVICQCKLLYDFLPRCGVVCLKENGLEADDLVYSVCEQYRDKYRDITIYSSDKDLYCNIDEEIVSFKSVVSTVPSMNSYGFIRNAIPGVELPLNSILLYKVFCGDKSDGIKVFKSSTGFSGSMFFDKIRELIKLKGLNSNYVRSLDFANLCIRIFKNNLSDDDCSELEKRISLIYPKEYSIELDRFTNRGDLDIEAFGSYLNLIKDRISLKNLGLREVQSSQLEMDYLYSYGKSLLSGEFLVDNSLSFKDDEEDRGFDLINLKEF